MLQPSCLFLVSICLLACTETRVIEVRYLPAPVLSTPVTLPLSAAMAANTSVSSSESQTHRVGNASSISTDGIGHEANGEECETENGQCLLSAPEESISISFPLCNQLTPSDAAHLYCIARTNQVQTLQIPRTLATCRWLATAARQEYEATIERMSSRCCAESDSEDDHDDNQEPPMRFDRLSEYLCRRESGQVVVVHIIPGGRLEPSPRPIPR